MNKKVKSFLADALTIFMRGIRPILGPETMCIYREKTCTVYAADQLRTQPLWKAVPAILWRFVKCNPITALVQKPWFR